MHSVRNTLPAQLNKEQSAQIRSQDVIYSSTLFNGVTYREACVIKQRQASQYREESSMRKNKYSSNIRKMNKYSKKNQEVWAIAGRIKVTEQGALRVGLRQAHPRARDVCKGCLPLLANSHIGIGVGCSSPAAVLGQILAVGWMFSAKCARRKCDSWGEP
jgi:hypothetical protein